MPRVSFTPDNKVETSNGFDRLKLKLNETARVAYIENPVCVWVHTLYAPVIGEDGKPEMHMAAPKVGEDPIPMVKKEYIGRFQCLGNEKTIEDNGVDTVNCPACVLASAKGGFSARPAQRYAMHIAKYNVKQGTASVSTANFGVQIQVWIFNGKTFNQLEELNSGDFPFSENDIKLQLKEPPEEMQKLIITPAKGAEWQATDERKALVREAFEESHVSEPVLESMAARKQDKTMVQSMVDTVKERWAVVNGEAVASKSEKTTEELNSMLNTKRIAKPVVEVDEEDIRPVKATARKAAKPPVVVEDDEDDEGDEPSAPVAKVMNLKEMMDAL